MKMTKKELRSFFTKKNLIKFLKKNKAQTFITKDCNNCPIAGFAGSNKKIESAEVTPDGISVQFHDEDNSAEIATPNWAAKFIEQVDDFNNFNNDSVGVEITGAQALNYLTANV